LRPHLKAAFERAAKGALYAISRYRDFYANLRTHLQCIIRRAGLTPWPKLFLNLRSTRETELAEVYPVHVVCAWIGNTERFAAWHYLQVTEDHFTLAAHSTPDSARKANPAQDSAQHGARAEDAPNEKTPEIPGSNAISAVFSAVEGYPQGDSNPCLLAENQGEQRPNPISPQPVKQSESSRCTTGCTKAQDTSNTLTVKALATALLALSPEERDRLAGMLVTAQGEGKAANDHHDVDNFSRNWG
jgi:hypothetical protein